MGPLKQGSGLWLQKSHCCSVQNVGGGVWETREYGAAKWKKLWTSYALIENVTDNKTPAGDNFS